MSKSKTCSGPCGRELGLDAFYTDPKTSDGRRARCKECFNAAIRARRSRPASAVETFDVGDDGVPDIDALAEMMPFGSAIERASVEAMMRAGSVHAAAVDLGLSPEALRAHLSELERRAATRGYAPGVAHTQTPTPVGYYVKGVSTQVDAEGNVISRWIKTNRDPDSAAAALLDAMSHIADAWTAKAEPSGPEYLDSDYDDDLLAVYPMGDPHIGLMSWEPETGEHFDLKIAERNLCEVVDKLVALAPPAREALVINVGDYFHSDNKSNTTTAGTRVDVDGRWAKVLAVGIRIMRRIIDSALTKHEKVTVITEIGNHDSHVSIMLALCLSQYYEREPRVHVDVSPAKFHWFRFGKCLIGTTHGDTVKFKDLGEIMACDRPQDWGETEHRYWYCGHIHHDTVKELRGVKVETFRTMAAADAWHRGQGYRSGRDMKVLILSRNHGEIERHTVGISQLLFAA